MSTRDDILQIAGRMVKYARVVRSRVNHGAAIFGEVDVNCEAASEGGKQTGQPVRFMQWYGFRVLPPLKAQDNLNPAKNKAVEVEQKNF